MGKIASNKDVAHQIANDIGKSVTDLQGISANSIESDNSTNVTVVGNANSAVDSIAGFVTQYESGIKQMMDDIKSVAENFEITDNDAKKQFEKIK